MFIKKYFFQPYSESETGDKITDNRKNKKVKIDKNVGEYTDYEEIK